MKRLTLCLCGIFFISLAAGSFAQPLQPEITATEQTEKKKDDTSKEATSAFTIGEIVVRDHAIPNIEDASTTTEISGKDIENRGDKSLGDSLQMVPGVSVYTTAKGFTGLSMRGFDHERVAIMVDGIPYLDSYYGGNNVDLSTIPVQNISRIIVNRGAASALYGALGSVGSINVITKRPEKLSASANIEYGEHQNWMVNASAGAPIGDFYTWVTASVQNSEGYEISGKLDRSERRRWFDKLTNYQVYGKTFADLTSDSVRNYLNDDNVWNHTSFRKYQVSGRAGYNINDKMETGVSVQWASNEQKSNSFSDNSLASYSVEDQDWSTPGFSGFWKDPYQDDNLRSAFQNRAFVWPEDTRLTISPYFKADLGNLKLKINTFYIKQRNVLEGYFNQDHDTSPTYPVTFPNATSYDGEAQSIFEDQSLGFYILPSYKIASWNTITANFHFRMDTFERYEKAIQTTSVLATTLGTGEYQTLELGARYVTIAVEDQMNFNTPAGALALSIGISYDAQDYGNIRGYDKTTDRLKDIPTAEDDSMIWGTRDSFNPVVSVVLDPIANFLRIRSAFAMKTNFPSMSVYKDIGTAVADGDAADIGLDPETIYSYNAGFELFFMNQAISFRSDYFYTRIKDKIEQIYDPASTIEVYDNIDGMTVHGVETIVTGSAPQIANLVTVRGSMSYVFAYARNDEVSPYTYGEEVQETPQHQFIAQLLLDFVTGTRLSLWGNYTLNQIQYVMAAAPPVGVTTFSSDYYKTVELHNPFMLHVKIQQELPFNTHIYVMCRNVLDDYNADPFNPGPGRMFYFGGGGRL